MIDIEEKRRKRLLFLHKLFEMADGEQTEIVQRSEIAKELDFDEILAWKIAKYLEGEYLIETISNGGATKLTHYGAREIEQALSEPDKPTEHFPPLNIIYVGGDSEHYVILDA